MLKALFVFSGDVTLIEPQGTVLIASEGENAMLKCISSDDQDIEWVLSSLLGELVIDPQPPLFITSALISGRTESFFTIEGVSLGDEGLYYCQGARDRSQSNKVRLVVTSGFPDGCKF